MCRPRTPQQSPWVSILSVAQLGLLESWYMERPRVPLGTRGPPGTLLPLLCKGFFLCHVLPCAPPLATQAGVDMLSVPGV